MAASQPTDFGTFAEAQAVLPRPFSGTTFKAWLDRAWIRAVRVGGTILYDLDSVRAMVQPVGDLTDAERAAIAESVATSPDPTDEQIAKVRSIIHSVGSTA